MTRLRGILLRDARDERGETLVEIIMAIALLGGAMATLLLGLLATFSLASARNGQALMSQASRTMSERLNALGVTSCASTASITTMLTSLNATSLGVTIGTPTYASGTIGSPVTWTTCSGSTNTGVLQVSVPLTWKGISPTGSATSTTTTYYVVVGP